MELETDCIGKPEAGDAENKNEKTNKYNEDSKHEAKDYKQENDKNENDDTCENTENVDSEEEKDEDLKLERGSKVQIAPPDQLADLGYSTLHELGIACAARLTQDPDTPRNWKQALNDPDWADSMKKEKGALKKKSTYILTPRKLGMAVLKGLWRYRTKNTCQGSIYKSRWVVDCWIIIEATIESLTL